jgi:hypothetical protein
MDEKNEAVSMTRPQALASGFGTRLLPGIALGGILYLMYSPVFLTDYLMNDEWILIGSRGTFRGNAKHAFFYWGRSLFGIYSTLVYRFVKYDPFRIQCVRFLNFASFCVIALLLFVFLKKRTDNALFSFLVVLFLYSQASFQGAMAYSLQLISNTQPAMWLSLLAFYIHFYLDSILPKTLRMATVFLLLVLAMQSTQTYAFFSMVPLSYLTLCDWKNQRRKVLEFIVLASVVFVISSLGYITVLHYLHSRGRGGYPLAEEAVEAAGHDPVQVLLHAFNPIGYWSAFEIWNYPFPFHNTPPLGTLKIALACFVMTAWAILVFWALSTEVQHRTPQERRETLLKWLAILVYMGFNAVFIVADSPTTLTEHRPHIVLSFVGIAIFCAAYSLRTLAAMYPAFGHVLPQALGIIFVVMIAFGAQAGLLRGYVNNHMEQLDFIRTELMTVDPSNYRNIILVLPERNDCVTEPCGPWAGQVTPGQWHLTERAGYSYALATIGIAPASKTIMFVRQKPHKIPEDSIVIDWQSYASVRYRQTNGLGSNTPLLRPGAHN